MRVAAYVLSFAFWSPLFAGPRSPQILFAVRHATESVFGHRFTYGTFGYNHSDGCKFEMAGCSTLGIPADQAVALYFMTVHYQRQAGINTTLRSTGIGICM